MRRDTLGRFGLVAALTAIFVVWPARPVSGYGTTSRSPAAPPSAPSAPAGPELRLTEGFRQILDFFAQRDFSLLTAWKEMRASGDPAFFEKHYPAISRELDSWAASLDMRFGLPAGAEGSLDFTFLVREFAPVIVDPEAPATLRDNALATVCMVCLMDGPRCSASALHGLLGAVILEDPSASRRAEALRWWRRSGDPIDEGLLERALAPPAGSDLDVRAEAARLLFTIDSPRSLRAQRLLVTTAGLPADPSGEQARISCEAMRRLSEARVSEAVPDMIRALSDPSRDVRACAAESLGELTGRDFGYVPGEQGPANLEAIARWRAWWKDHQGGGSAAIR